MKDWKSSVALAVIIGLVGLAFYLTYFQMYLSYTD